MAPLSGNVHEFDVGFYRSGQLGGDQLAGVVREHGIRTVVNLRGVDPGKGWYDAEVRAVTGAGAVLASVPLSANREPDPAVLARLVELLRTSPKPLLIHCEAGADRSGLASAIYVVAVARRGVEEAGRQLSFRYGRFPWPTSRSGAMDRAFRTFAASYEGVGH
jgi:protein tyrosine/serine phosphatase